MGFIKRDKPPRHLDKERRNLYAPPEEASYKKSLLEGPADVVVPKGAARAVPVRKGLGLRIDVPTVQGAEEGIVPLLGILAERGARATFFLNMGPDRTGLGLGWALARPSLWCALLRRKRLSALSIRTLASGMFLPARSAPAAAPDAFREVLDAGHELGVLPWNVRTWMDDIQRCTEERAGEEIGKALEAFRAFFGREASCFASPDCLCNDETLRFAAGQGLIFASDSRGTDPFLPVLSSGTVVNLPQIPVTLPTLPEAASAGERLPEEALAALPAEIARQDWPVYQAFAEWEGRRYAGAFAAFLDGVAAAGTEIRSLGAQLESRLEVSRVLPPCTLSYAQMDGGLRAITQQMFEV